MATSPVGSDAQVFGHQTPLVQAARGVPSCRHSVGEFGKAGHGSLIDLVRRRDLRCLLCVDRSSTTPRRRRPSAGRDRAGRRIRRRATRRRPARPVTPAVVIDRRRERRRFDAISTHVHVIALAWPRRPAGPGPRTGTRCCPTASARPLLARAVANAFADLDASAEMRAARARAERAERHRHPAVRRAQSRRAARADPEQGPRNHGERRRLALPGRGGGGRRAPRLFFALAQNDSVTIPVQAATLPLDNASVAGHVALTGKTVNLDDAYRLPPGSPFHINRAFDEQTGYRTKSMLVVPMRTPHGETHRRPPAHQLQARGRRTAGRPRDDRAARAALRCRARALAESLASQAAVAVDNSRLYQSIRRLFEGFVKRLGHRHRVPRPHHVRSLVPRRRADGGPGRRRGPLRAAAATRATRFTADEIRELRYAALLHDFGKVGRARARAAQGQEALPGRARAHPPACGPASSAAWSCVPPGASSTVLLRRGQRGYAEEAAGLDAELAAAAGRARHEALERHPDANEPSVLPAGHRRHSSSR